MYKKKKIHFGDNLYYQIRKKESFLCLGLDPHLDLIPDVFQSKNKINKIIYSKENLLIVEKFCMCLIETCIELVPVIKLQIAFFEQLGPEGLKLLAKLCQIIKKTDTICIIDSKRGDIGSTNQAYFNTFFSSNSAYHCDAITINPWLGIDSIKVFTEKIGSHQGLFILVHTSNPGSADLQKKVLVNGNKVYEELVKMLKPIIKKHKGKTGLSSIGIVTGATNKKETIKLRKGLTECPFLIPGFGAQGGSLESARAGLIKDSNHKNVFNMGIINSSRGLCFPKKANKISTMKDWKKIIQNNLLKTNLDLKSH